MVQDSLTKAKWLTPCGCAAAGDAAGERISQLFLSSTQHHVDSDGVKRKDNEAICGLLQNARIQQRMHVAVHGFHIATDAARRLADRHRPHAGQSANELPSLRRQQPEQKLRRGKADTRTLPLALEGVPCPPLDLLKSCHLQR